VTPSHFGAAEAPQDHGNWVLLDRPAEDQWPSGLDHQHETTYLCGELARADRQGGSTGRLPKSRYSAGLTLMLLSLLRPGSYATAEFHSDRRRSADRRLVNSVEEGSPDVLRRSCVARLDLDGVLDYRDGSTRHRLGAVVSEVIQAGREHQPPTPGLMPKTAVTSELTGRIGGLASDMRVSGA
jgi:hypothetical protein